MNASELNRKLLFCGHREATDYLKDSPLNRYLYKLFIEVLPKYQMNVDVVTLFNEIYYQCVRVNYDGTPGVDIEQRYLAEEEAWIKSDVAAQLVFCIVWTLFKNKRNVTFHEECFFCQLSPLIKKGEFYDLTKRITEDFRSLGIEVPDTFPPMRSHISAIPQLERNVFGQLCFKGDDNWLRDEKEREKNKQELKEYCDAWETITSNFSYSVISKYEQLYYNGGGYIPLLKTIGQSRFSKSFEESYLYTYNIDDKFISSLKEEISSLKEEDGIGADRFEQKEPHSELYENPYFSSDEDGDDWHEPAATDKESGRAELLQKECEKLKYDLVEQQQQHELEISKMKAQYGAEIAALKKKLALLSGEEKVAEACSTTGESDSKDIALSVSEMVAHVKECFDEAAAYQFCHLFYSLASKHGHLNKEASALIDSIIPAIKVREARHQTINIPSAQQVNVNLQSVIN